MLDAGDIVIAVGGGGIPVVREDDGDLRGVEAVIDKDLASARLAIDRRADMLLILIAVEKVCRDFGRPSQKALEDLHLDEAKTLLEERPLWRGQHGAKDQGCHSVFARV